MRITKLISFALIFAAIIFITPHIGAAGGSDSSLCVTQNDLILAKDEKKNVPDYRQYLNRTKTLECILNKRRLEEIHDEVNTQFYGSISESRLASSTKSEIIRLLEAANIQNSFRSRSFKSSEDCLDAAINSFGDRVDQSLLLYSAICGLLKALDDPYTVFMTPAEYSLLMERVQNRAFCGVGVYIDLDRDNNNWLTIVEPMEGSSAESAGLRSGDIITEIDGVSTKGISLDLAVSRLRGQKGSPVTVTVRKRGVNDEARITLLCEMIQTKSVSSRIIQNNIGYVKLRIFGADTGRELEAALRDMQNKEVRGVILDLRNNKGGYISTAVDVVGMFIESGKLVVSVRDKNGKTSNHTSKGKFKIDVPLAVLVNRYSASASEIAAGAIKDYGRGTLIGARTFGKGSVQIIHSFNDGSALKITTCHYYTPKGTDIDKKGLEPDQYMEMDSKEIGKENDIQLMKAINLLQGKFGDLPPVTIFKEKY